MAEYPYVMRQRCRCGAEFEASSPLSNGTPFEGINAWRRQHAQSCDFMKAEQEVSRVH